MSLSSENDALWDRVLGPNFCPYDFDHDSVNRILNAAREEGRIEGYAQCVEDDLGAYMAENP